MSDVKSLTASVNNLTASNISAVTKILRSLSETEPIQANVRVSLRLRFLRKIFWSSIEKTPVAIFDVDGNKNN